MRIKIIITIIVTLFISFSAIAQNVSEPLTDNPNIFIPIYKEVDKSTHQGEYYNYEYMTPAEVSDIYSKKVEEVRAILHGTYKTTQQQELISTNLTQGSTQSRAQVYGRYQQEGSTSPNIQMIETIQGRTQQISLPPLDQNLNEMDRENIYVFFDFEQTWEKYIETRLFFEPLSSHFDIIANWRDGKKATNSFYQGVLQQRDSLGLTVNDSDSKYQTRLLQREIARNNMINWLKMKEERVLEEVDGYIINNSGNDNKGTTKVIGRLRKPTPYETVLGEPVPTEKTELIKE